MSRDLKYKVGDKVRIKSLDWYNKNKDCTGCLVCGESHINSDMKCMLGEIVTIIAIDGNHYRIKEYGWNWTDEMIEGLVTEMDCMNNTPNKIVSFPEEQAVKIEDVLNGKYRYVEGRPVIRSHADLPQKITTDFEKAFDWFIQHYHTYITVTMSSEYCIESEIKVNDMWKAYKKAMEEQRYE